MRGIGVLVTIGVLLFCAPIVPSRAQSSQTGLLATTNPTDDGFVFIDIDTGEHFSLSFGPQTHLFGDFSPDGCQITFLLEQIPDRYDLFVANIDGSNFRQIMFLGQTGALNYRVFEPQWSPDGSRILMTLIRYYDPPGEDPKRESNIVWVTPEGGLPNYYSVSGYEWQPRWTPDGAEIVYVSEQPILFGPNDAPLEPDEDAPRYPEIWIGGRDGDNKRRVTNLGEIAAYNPRFSPDGTQLAYLIQPVDNNHRLLVLDLATGTTRALNQSLATVLDYTWQPDSQGIVAAMQGWAGVATNHLWRFSIQHHTDPEFIVPDEDFMDYPRFSTDGGWLAFRSAYEVVVMNMQTGDLLHLGEITRHNSPPVWAKQRCVN